jgi:hypothetical protein
LIQKAVQYGISEIQEIMGWKKIALVGLAVGVGAGLALPLSMVASHWFESCRRPWMLECRDGRYS